METGATDVRALARLGLAHAAAESSDHARSVVAHVGDDYAPGELIAHARRLRFLDLIVLDRTVLAERAAGTPWHVIAQALSLSEAETIRRYQTTYDDWVVSTLDPTPGPPISPVAYLEGSLATEDPAGTAQRLDAWVERHADWDDVPVPQPVSRILT